MDKNSVKQTLLDQFHSDSEGHSDDEFRNEDSIDENKSNENVDVFNFETVYIKVEDVNENCTNQNQVERDMTVLERKEDNDLNSEHFSKQISNTDIKREEENKLIDKISTVGTHTGEKQHKCHLCSKTFTQKRNLNIHIRTHTGEKPFKCHICSKAFVRKVSLIIHIRTHTREKPVKCHICTKAFNDKRNLSRHIRIHTGEKLFKCHLCSLTFNQKQNLNSHIKTHSAEKQFKCHLCSKTFAQKRNLNNHIRIHTGEEPFRCHLCSKAFAGKYILSLHVRTHDDTIFPNEHMDILESDDQNNIKVEDMNEKETLLEQVEEDIFVFKREKIDIDSDLLDQQILNDDVNREVDNKLIDKDNAQDIV